MKYIILSLSLFASTVSLAAVKDLEMGKYKLTSSEPFLGFDSLFIGANKSIILNGKVGTEQIPDPGCVGTYKLENSVMKIEVLCQPTYFLGGILRCAIDLNQAEAGPIYSSEVDGADISFSVDGMKESIPFKIKYVYPEK